MIHLGHKDNTDVLKKLAIYYNISIPIGKGIVNYEPDPISDYNDVENFLPSNWKDISEFEVNYYKGRYLDLGIKIENDEVYLTSAPWITVLGFNSDTTDEEAEEILEDFISLDLDDPIILTRHQNRMLSFKDIVDSQITNISSEDGLTEDQKSLNYDIKKITEEKINELLENYSERF